ncbi:Arylsulfatase [Rubripirellula lacrimiformis]|uniref:Arylsulfatase n=1 Tax=Rubripirellula lacrimiformis TaxID=1930273 RepID=A0A517NGP2_9BACT|nr:sulfatase-like hydrolase/transferase [Rubripirellula lacrimiformis]QDT06305.1 Arylsulfatase [Rubripirellula lacrimiformis]
MGLRNLASTLACFTTLLTGMATAAERPNVILVMCDDLGVGDLARFHDASPIQTPHLDAMADDGLVFNRFYAAAPVCSPTRGSCLTGRHPFRYGIYFANTGHMKVEEHTLPEILKDHGYTTGHFGKWHLGTLTKTIKDANRGGPSKQGIQHFSPPSIHGYDDSFVTESKVPTYDPMIRPVGAKVNGAWDAVRDKSSAQHYGTHYWDHDGNVVTENLEGDDSRVIMDRAIPFIEKAAESKTPFFAAVWFHSPHLPVVAGPKHVQPYADRDVESRNYFGCISAMDEQVGRLRAKLADLGVADNTMIWFTSDNGPEGQDGKAPGSAGDFRGRKRSLYEGGVRVPGILVWPGHAKPNSVTDHAAVTSDYLPTVLDAIGVELPADRPIDGVSLLDAINDPKLRRQAPIGFQSANQIAWHHGRHKLISNDKGTTWQLYDIESDPGESSDLAGDQPDRVDALRTEVEQWIASCRASDKGGDYLVATNAKPHEVASSQKDWYEKYKKQENAPEPSEMLLNTDVEPELDNGFIDLLNGKDLSDWTPRGGTCSFKYVDGMVVGETVADSPSTYLCTQRDDYKDFIFTCEMKWEVDGNSGVMFRARSKTEGDRVTVFGPQAEMEGITGDRGWSGGIYGQSCGGYFYPLWLTEHQDARTALNKTGWNRLTVEARGNVVKTWINGVPAAHWVDTDDSYPSGFLGLQIHKGKNGKVLWRGLQIKEL